MNLIGPLYRGWVSKGNHESHKSAHAVGVRPYLNLLATLMQAR